MADVYLSLDSDMRNHLKVRKFCRLMQTKLAIAHLIDFWSAAITQAPDGDLSRIDPEDVEGMAGYDMGDMRCYRALVDCGFVDEVDEDGKPCRRIHNWMKPGRTGYAMKKKTEAVENWRRSMNRGKGRGRSNTPVTGSVVDDQEVTDAVADESPIDDPSMTHGEPIGSAGDENPLHGSRFTVHQSGSPPPPEISGPDQTRVRVSEPVLPPPRSHRKPYAAFMASTPAFMAVYSAYPRKDARTKAAATFQELAWNFEGGEEALSKTILAWFATGVLRRHPYAGEDRFRPLLETVISERRWEDAQSAPDDDDEPRRGGPKELPYA
jgi:hypothetical protein